MCKINSIYCTVYLDQESINLLEMYGDISHVTDMVLEYMFEQGLTPSQLPSVVIRNNCKRVNIQVTNEDYIALTQLYPAKSSAISLRRVLNWFITNEIYSEWPITPTNTINNKKQDKFKSKLLTIKTKLINLNKLLNSENLTNAIEFIDKEINNGKQE